MRMGVWSWTLLTGLTRIWRCLSCSIGHGCGSGSGLAVGVAWVGSCSSNSTPSLGTSVCCRCSCKKKNKIASSSFYMCLLLLEQGNRFTGSLKEIKLNANMSKILWREERLVVKDFGTQKSLTVPDTTGFLPHLLNAWSRKHTQHKRYLGLWSKRIQPLDRNGTQQEGLFTRSSVCITLCAQTKIQLFKEF